MKLEKLSDDNLIVFLNKFYIDKYKLLADDNLEDYFKNIFKMLNKYYNIEIAGYYNINLYQDDIYGYVLDIRKEDLDFYGYYDEHVDMKIAIIKDNKFIFEINDYSVLKDDILKNCYLLKVEDNLYLVPKKTITQYLLGNIIENCKLIYGSKAKIILSKGQYINTNKNFV